LIDLGIAFVEIRFEKIEEWSRRDARVFWKIRKAAGKPELFEQFGNRDPLEDHGTVPMRKRKRKFVRRVDIDRPLHVCVRDLF